ncbi:MAG: LPS assembly protein LptD [Motiliproteus sp.]
MAARLLAPLSNPRRSGIWKAPLCLLILLLCHNVQAEQPAAEALLWSCSSVDDGKEWECTVNEDAVNQSPEKTDIPPAVAADNSQPSRDIEKSPEATSQPIAPQPAEDIAGEDESYGPLSEPLTLQPSVAPPIKVKDNSWQQPRYTRTHSQYECQPDGDSWDCQGSEAPLQAIASDKNYLASYPDAYAVPKQPPLSRKKIEPLSVSDKDIEQASTDIKKPVQGASQQQWDCQPSRNDDNWDCQPLKDLSPTIQPLHAQPQSYAQSKPAPVRNEQPASTSSQQQWDCQPSSDNNNWDCQPIANSSRAVSQASSTYTSSVTPNQAPYPYAFLDWYEFADGPDPLTHCPGQYIEPPARYNAKQLAAEEHPLYVRANKTRTRGGSTTLLEGNVHLQKGNQQLRSQVAQLDHDNERAEFQGQVLFREPGTLLLGDSAVFDQARGVTRVNNAEFVFHQRHAHGSASTISHYDNGNTYITDGSYTTCEPGYDGWSINSRDIVLNNEEGEGVAKHATLEIAGVPVFYLPVFSFPIDDRRKSGFLTPSFSISEDSGVDITAPYYFNLAPHYDLTLAPRFIRKRGLMLESEFRYLHEFGQYDFSMAALPGDDLRNSEDRWVLGIKHNGQPAPGWSSNIDFTRVSDNDYFDDLDTSLNISQETHLDQRASLAYSANDWRLETTVQSYQTITDASAPYQKLPQIRFSGRQYLAADDALDLSYSAEYTAFDRDSSGFTGINRITGNRIHLDSTLATEYSWPWAYLRPKLRLTHTSYDLSDQTAGADENPNRTLPLFSIDSGLYLDRDTEFAGKAYIHTLEPRLFYLYVPEEDQTELPDFDSSELTFSYSQLFRDNRFSGSDRIGDTNQVTLGLTTRLLQDNGQELLHASVGQIFYLQDREVRLQSSSSILTDSTSDFAAETTWRITKEMRLTADGQWDNHDFSNTKRNLKLSYLSDLDHQVNFSYRFTRNDLEQTDLSFIWPINAQWSLLARWLNDIENSEALDQVLGLEYENCCWKIRTLYRQWIDDDTDDRENSGIFLQFTMKGLGTFGTKAVGDSGPQAKNFLDDITGFNTRENIE